jgi:alginate O-acetyltransferase complex protein AlgI
VLFNSYDFALYFLPLALVVFYLLARVGGPRYAAAWLGLASLVFYGYWAPRFLPLLVGSIVVNYMFGHVLRSLARADGRGSERARKAVLILAIAANLGLLFYFKYANFFIRSAGNVLGTSLGVLDVVLPIGISFFTFTQIAYLVDTWEGKVEHTDPWHYLLFVTFFPHLIAGPILHHAEMMPQFEQRETYRFRLDWFASGALIFVIGLGKKVILADGIQPYVGPIFDHATTQPPTFFPAWGGALAYTLQLYFDFSGYTDMAIGLSRMLNIRLPLNFDSPYKATNISDFWRRWHMTLSRFLRDYLYVPLGGNRHGRPRRYANLLATMVLGGLWHGAAWTFVIWGALHGLYLCIYHGWTALRRRVGWVRATPSRLGIAGARALTLVAVVVGWVFFRAETIPSALAILKGMSGANGIEIPQRYADVFIVSAMAANGMVDVATSAGSGDDRQLVWTLLLLALALFFPNSNGLARSPAGYAPALRARGMLLLLGVLVPVALLLLMINASRGISEFIYFNF